MKIIDYLKNIRNMLPPNKKVLLPTNNLSTVYPLYRVGTIGHGSCFFHGLVYCMSQQYRTMGEGQRVNLIKKLRIELSDLFDRETYDKLGNGNLAELGIQLPQFSFANLKDGLRNYNNWIGSEYREFVSNMLNINVHIIWYKDGELQAYKAMIDPNDNKLFKMGRHSVILYWQNGNHFEVIGRDVNGQIGYLFYDDDPLIQTLQDDYKKSISI